MAPRPLRAPSVGFLLAMTALSLFQMAAALLAFLVPASVLAGMDSLALHWAEAAVVLLPIAIVGFLFAITGAGSMLVASPLAFLTVCSLRPWEASMPWLARGARVQTSTAWILLGLCAFAPNALFLDGLWALHVAAVLTWPMSLAHTVLRPVPRAPTAPRPRAS